MNVSASRNNDHLLQWIAAAMLLVGIVLVDTAITAWIASLVTLWQLAASVASYLLVAVGLLFTIWQIRAIGNKPTR